MTFISTSENCVQVIIRRRSRATLHVGNAKLCAVSWFFLIVGGVAHVCRHIGAAETPTSTAVETAAMIVVYALAGTSEFVDVSYELAVGNVNIHVLTTLAVLGTVLLGCAMEGALLLVLFASAHFVEDRLTGHARGDLRWGMGDWELVGGYSTRIPTRVAPHERSRSLYFFAFARLFLFFVFGSDDKLAVGDLDG